MKQLTKQEAQKELEKVNQKAKELQEIIDQEDEIKLKTVEDAIAQLGEDDVLVKELRLLEVNNFSIQTIYRQRVMIWVKAINGGWEADWDDENQYKWTPWFYLNKPLKKGFLLSGASYYRVSVGSSFSVGLIYKNEELALYSGKQIEEEYYKMMKG